MRTRVKYHVIYLHRKDYPVTVMCQFFEVSRSGYYDFVHRLGRSEPDAELGQLLREQQARTRQTYGYRRMQLWLEWQGIHRSATFFQTSPKGEKQKSFPGSSEPGKLFLRPLTANCYCATAPAMGRGSSFSRPRRAVCNTFPGSPSGILVSFCVTFSLEGL